MTTDEVLDHFGGASKAANVLGITRQAIYMWGAEPPKGKQYQIQVLTKGKLKAATEEPKTKTKNTH